MHVYTIGRIRQNGPAVAHPHGLWRPPGGPRQGPMYGGVPIPRAVDLLPDVPLGGRVDHQGTVYSDPSADTDSST